MSTARAAIGDWRLERYRLGELPAGELDTIRTALAADGDLAERLARLDRSDGDILAQHPPAVIAASVGRGPRPRAPDGRATRVRRAASLSPSRVAWSWRPPVS